MSKEKIEIRKSTRKDVNQIMAIFTTAREYMIEHGNKTQWGDGYPDEEILKADIDAGNSYVFVNNGVIVGTFSFIIGEEPTYRIIRNGKWTDDRTYGTIHRLASNGTVKGIARMCFEYCMKQIDYIRIDTHKDNIPMQTAIERFGFQKCGKIYVRDGAERIAYDYISISSGID